MIDNYIRRARLLKVIDGDTIELDIDLGFCIWRLKQRVRVLGINCPERKGKTKLTGDIAKQFTETWFITHPIFYVRTYVDDTDNFGRVLADIVSGSDSLAQALLLTNNATIYEE